MIRSLGLMVLGAGFVVVACGSDDDAPSAKYPTADAFCAAKADEECKVAAAPCTVNLEQCKSARKNACNALAGAATSQGRAYRPENAEECIKKTTEVYADRVIVAAKESAFLTACGKVFSGSKQRNEACENEFDCEGTLACDLDKKVCAVKVEKKIDEPCNNPGDICAKDSYCQTRGALKFCGAKSKLGEACRIPETPCADDVRCNGTSCVALQEAAQSCDVDGDCATNFCNSEKKCQARQYASETGSCKDFGGS